MPGREIVLDTETTGLDRRTDRVVEIGCVEIVDLMPTGDSFHVFANPQIPVHPEALKVHGLSNEFLSTKPVIRRTLPGFLAYIRDSPLVIHNAPFDVGMLNAELVRADLPRLTNPIVDTLDLARKVRPGKTQTLDVLARHFKVSKLKDRTKHGAIIDCEILAEVYAGLRGGRQISLGLFDTSVESDASGTPLPYHADRNMPGASLDEMVLHLDFIRTLKSPVWAQYLDLSDVEVEAFNF